MFTNPVPSFGTWRGVISELACLRMMFPTTLDPNNLVACDPSIKPVPLVVDHLGMRNPANREGDGEPYRPSDRPFQPLQLMDLVRHPSVEGLMQILGIDSDHGVAWCKPLADSDSSNQTFPLDELDRDDVALRQEDAIRVKPEGVRIHRFYELSEQFYVYQNGERTRSAFPSFERAEEWADLKVADAKRTKVGFWRYVWNDVCKQYDHLPHPKEFVDTDWADAEREIVVEQLRETSLQDHELKQYRGFSRCRICDERNGSKEYYSDEFRWPEGYGHYVAEHGVKPPQEFIDYLLKRAG